MIYFRIYNPYSVWYYVFCATLVVAFFFTLPHRNGMSLGVDYLIRRKHGDLAKDASVTPKPRMADEGWRLV